MTQPLLQGFTLLHKQRAAQAAFDQAVARYGGTVLTAFQNVANAIRALQSDADGLRAAAAAEKAAICSLDITRERLQLGQMGCLALLNAENTHAQARLALVQGQTVSGLYCGVIPGSRRRLMEPDRDANCKQQFIDPYTVTSMLS